MKYKFLLLLISTTAFASDLERINLLGDEFVVRSTYRTEISYPQDIKEICYQNKKQVKTFVRSMKLCLDSDLGDFCEIYEKDLHEYNESVDGNWDPTRYWIGKFKVDTTIPQQQHLGTNVTVNIGDNAGLFDIQLDQVSEEAQVAQVEKYLSSVMSKSIDYTPTGYIVNNKFLICDLYQGKAKLKGVIDLEIKNIKRPSRTNIEAAWKAYSGVKRKRSEILSQKNLPLKYARIGFELSKYLPESGTLNKKVNFETLFAQIVKKDAHELVFIPYSDKDEFININFPTLRAEKKLNLKWENL
jgi:hypothetical protein